MARALSPDGWLFSVKAFPWQSLEEGAPAGWRVPARECGFASGWGPCGGQRGTRLDHQSVVGPYSHLHSFPPLPEPLWQTEWDENHWCGLLAQGEQHSVCQQEKEDNRWSTQGSEERTVSMEEVNGSNRGSVVRMHSLARRFELWWGSLH